MKMYCIFTLFFHYLPTTIGNKFPKLGPGTPDDISFTNLGDSTWFAPIIILGGIYAGIFTPSEAAAVAVAYGLFVGFFIYKGLTISKLFLSQVLMKW